MKKILVPTDFSKTADNAIQYALALAEKFSAEIIVVNAYVPTGTSVMIDLTDLLKLESERDLRIIKGKIKKTNPNIKLTTFAFEGDLTHAIKSCVKEEAIDIIVMGTTGGSGMKAKFMGSNTASVIQKVSVPLIAVPDGFVLNDNLKIAVSTDLHNLKNSKVFDSPKKIAKAYSGVFYIVNVTEDLGEIDPVDFIDHAADVDDLFTGFEHTFKFLEGEDYEREILEFITIHNIDLLVVVSRKRNFVNRLFHKSISKQLTMHSTVPILVLTD